MLERAVALLLCGTLSAQVSYQVSCVSGTATAGLDHQSMPTGPVGAGRSIRASDRIGNCSADASLSVRGLFFDASSSAVADSVCYSYHARSAGSFVVEFVSPQPVACVVSLVLLGSIGNFSTSRGSSVDIGADGSTEFSWSSLSSQGESWSFQAVVGPQPLRVGIHVWASSSAQAGWPAANASLTAVLGITTGGTGWLATSGARCGAGLGAYVARTATTKFGFAVDGAPVTPHAFLVVGLRDAQLPIPPTMCVLRTDILVPLSVTVQPDGSGIASFTLPNSVRGLIRAQFLAATVDAQNLDHWWTSNAIQIALP
jgi:hypothetical protein